MPRLKEIIKRVLPPIVIDGWQQAQRVTQRREPPYNPRTSVAWTAGYAGYKMRLLQQGVRDETLLDRFRRGTPLPSGYGVGVDERCVEYPWFLAQLPPGAGRLLDAGSALNYQFLIDHPRLHGKSLDIVTLAPEHNCFWQKKISYLYADLREIPIRDAFYDAVACISTLEHVGCDNFQFSGDERHREKRLDDFVEAMHELRRVLKPGGTLLLTVPYGVGRDYGVFQQFDEGLLSRAIEAFGPPGQVSTAFYRYTAEGWNTAAQADAADARYVDWIARVWRGEPGVLRQVEPDMATAARAVACVRLVKQGGA